jgi:hypothetical protein
VLVLLVATSCDLAAFGPSAERVCAQQATEFGPNFTVAAAFNSRVEAVRAMRDPTVIEPDLWPDTPDDSPAIVCFLDGPVPKAPPGGEQFNRAVVGIANDEAILVIAGYQDSLPVQEP